jgi:Rha family phage regulatory protein
MAVIQFHTGDTIMSNQTLSINPSEFCSIINRSIRTTSVKVAKAFGKRHDDILKKVKNIDCSPDFRLRNFAETQIEVKMPTGGVRKSLSYEMTKDGFIFLVMSFTGKKAAQTKETYINVFNAMEKKLNTPYVPPIPKTPYIPSPQRQKQIPKAPSFPAKEVKYQFFSNATSAELHHQLMRYLYKLHNMEGIDVQGAISIAQSQYDMSVAYIGRLNEMHFQLGLTQNKFFELREEIKD